MRSASCVRACRHATVQSLAAAAGSSISYVGSNCDHADLEDVGAHSAARDRPAFWSFVQRTTRIQPQTPTDLSCIPEAPVLGESALQHAADSCGSTCKSGFPLQSTVLLNHPSPTSRHHDNLPPYLPQSTQNALLNEPALPTQQEDCVSQSTHCLLGSSMGRLETTSGGSTAGTYWPQLVRCDAGSDHKEGLYGSLPEGPTLAPNLGVSALERPEQGPGTTSGAPRGELRGMSSMKSSLWPEGAAELLPTGPSNAQRLALDMWKTRQQRDVRICMRNLLKAEASVCPRYPCSEYR